MQKSRNNCNYLCWQLNETFTSSLPSKTFTAYEVDFFVFSGTAFSTSKFVFVRNNGKTFPHLKFLKQDLHRISNSSFENWGISLELGNITRIFPSFGWGILCHVTRLDQSRASENIWWIISAHISRGYTYSWFSRSNFARPPAWPWEVWVVNLNWRMTYGTLVGDVNLVPRVLRLLGQRFRRQERLWGNGIFSIFLIGYLGNNEMLTLPSIMSRASQETSAIFQRGQQVTLLVRDWRISTHLQHLLVSAFGWPFTINGSVKRNRNFGFEFQSSHVIEKRYNPLAKK